jgi:RNA polymerase sigma-70 factor, ECF subfamily
METAEDEFDDALVRAKSGDETGFLLLWENLHPRLLRYLRVLGCEDVDDVASEAWLQAVRDLDGFQGTAAGFRSWLFAIGRHRAIDAARSRHRFREMVLALVMRPPTPSSPATVEDEVLDEFSTRQAVAMVAGLPADQAEVVALRIIAGLDTGDTARILGKSPGAIRVALHRGLRRLSADMHDRTTERVER